MPGAVSYDVVVRTQITHRVAYTVRGLESTSYTSPKLSLGNYELWVIANGMNGLRSAWASEGFKVIAPPRPVLTVGGPGYAYGDPFGFPISWIGVAGADHYDLWITDEFGRNVVRELNVSSTAYSLNAILPRAMYRIWVRAVYTDATFSPWSIPETFQVY